MLEIILVQGFCPLKNNVMDSVLSTNLSYPREIAISYVN